MLRLLLALVVTFTVPPAAEIGTPPSRLSIEQADSWTLWTWNASHNVYCECDLEVQRFDRVKVTREGGRVQVEIPPTVKPGPRWAVLVAMHGDREGQASMTLMFEAP